MKHRLLIVTDHLTHSISNSLYELAPALQLAGADSEVWVCSRGSAGNEAFFEGQPADSVIASPVNGQFSFRTDGSSITSTSQLLSLEGLYAILVRMPQPLNPTFLLSLTKIVPSHKIINDPAGTIETVSSDFLMNVSQLCPCPRMCFSLHEAIALSHQYEIVLKPLYSYAGKGIVRLSTRYYWVGDIRHDIERVYELLPDIHFPMLAMRYLSNVSFGDKRTIVVNQQIMGSALRMPPADSWICNVAQGGHAVISEIDEAELLMEQELTPLLYDKGVIMYGFDTLVDDNGLRVL